MLYKSKEGKNVEILRSNYKDDKSYFSAILKAKGFLVKNNEHEKKENKTT
jgi:hypothetical protein